MMTSTMDNSSKQVQQIPNKFQILIIFHVPRYKLRILKKVVRPRSSLCFRRMPPKLPSQRLCGFSFVVLLILTLILAVTPNAVSEHMLPSWMNSLGDGFKHASFCTLFTIHFWCLWSSIAWLRLWVYKRVIARGRQLNAQETSMSVFNLDDDNEDTDGDQTAPTKQPTTVIIKKRLRQVYFCGRMAGVMALMSSFALTSEVVQNMSPYRSFQWMDVLYNLCGSLIGLVSAFVGDKLYRWLYGTSPYEQVSLLDDQADASVHDSPDVDLERGENNTSIS